MGATVSTGAMARAIVDPEVLILMSLWMVEDEQRLADVVWSWTTRNSPLLSIQRLRNLGTSFPAEVRARLSALAATRVAEGDPRWKSLRTRKAEPLGERTGKARAVEPPLASWASLMLQLRLGLGVGVKADVLTFMLGSSNLTPEWASVATIADALGYTAAGVRRAADDLARARFIRSLDTTPGAKTSQRMFTGHPGSWNNVLGIGYEMPGWGYWRERCRFVIDLLTWLEGEADRGTDYVRDVGAARLLKAHGATLRRDQVVDAIEYSDAELGFEYLAAAARSLMRWLENNG